MDDGREESSSISLNELLGRSEPERVERRGRPVGSYKDDPYRDINPLERKVALLRASGMSLHAIAIQVEKPHGTIQNILARSHVARFLTRMEISLCTEIAPIAR